MGKIKVAIFPPDSSNIDDAVKLVIKGDSEAEELNHLTHLMTTLWQTTEDADAIAFKRED